jgi:hypothetical protein
LIPPLLLPPAGGYVARRETSCWREVQYRGELFRQANSKRGWIDLSLEPMRRAGFPDDFSASVRAADGLSAEAIGVG